jgi:hypothetical protein
VNRARKHPAARPEERFDRMIVRSHRRVRCKDRELVGVVKQTPS